MSAATYTPGPWRVARNGPWVVECPTQIPDVFGKVCDVGYKPNASLIAAAPDLLEALRTIVSAMPKDGGMVRFDGDELAAARAAIAKAVGQ